MADFVKMQLPGGGTVLVQVSEKAAEAPPQGLAPVARDPTGIAVQRFEAALQDIRHVANSLQEALTNLARQPDSATVEFGVTFSAEGGVIIATGGVEANLKVVLKWGKGD